MENLKLWFEPLLWIIGTITTLCLFVRLCKPLWKFITAPSLTATHLEEIEKKFDAQLKELTKKVEELADQNAVEDSITLSLLHDSIVQIYEQAKKENYISEVNYYRVCELYKQDGNSEYIDGLMRVLREMHRKDAVAQCSEQ